MCFCTGEDCSSLDPQLPPQLEIYTSLHHIFLSTTSYHRLPCHTEWIAVLKILYEELNKESCYLNNKSIPCAVSRKLGLPYFVPNHNDPDAEKSLALLSRYLPHQPLWQSSSHCQKLSFYILDPDNSLFSSTLLKPLLGTLWFVALKPSEQHKAKQTAQARLSQVELSKWRIWVILLVGLVGSIIYWLQ